MKFKTTLKAMRNNYHVAVSGYCELQTLLRNQEPIAYNSGTYGWNCDFYYLGDNVMLCTGYRPIGERYLPYGRYNEYEKKAQEIVYNHSFKDYDTERKELDKLFNDFCNEIKSAIYC